MTIWEVLSYVIFSLLTCYDFECPLSKWTPLFGLGTKQETNGSSPSSESHKKYSRTDALYYDFACLMYYVSSRKTSISEIIVAVRVIYRVKACCDTYHNFKVSSESRDSYSHAECSVNDQSPYIFTFDMVKVQADLSFI